MEVMNKFKHRLELWPQVVSKLKEMLVFQKLFTFLKPCYSIIRNFLVTSNGLNSKPVRHLLNCV